MENNLGLRTLPKTPHMNFNGKRTSAANILATHPETNPPTPVGVQTHMGLLFSPIFPPLPELAHTTRRVSEGDPGFSKSGSRNMTLRSSLRKPIIKRCGKVSPPTFSDGLPGGKRPCGPSRSGEKLTQGSGWPTESSYQHPLSCWSGGGARRHRQRGASVKAATSTCPCAFAAKRPPANDGELESTSAAASPQGGYLKD